VRKKIDSYPFCFVTVKIWFDSYEESAFFAPSKSYP